MLAAMKLAHGEAVKLIDAQLELRKRMGLPDKVVEEPEDDKALYDKVASVAAAELKSILLTADKQERESKFDAIKDETLTRLQEEDPEADPKAINSAFEELEISIVRDNVLKDRRRIDGRGMHDLRPISGQVGLLPRTHGSSVFTRGETQALATVTLGTKSDAQSMDAITGGPDEKNFMLHYNFPPYSVGEAGRIMGPGRREIGHGNLAERSLRQVMPRRVPVHRARGLRDHGIQRFQFHGQHLRRHPGPHGRGRPDLQAGGRHLHRPLHLRAMDKAELVTDIIGSEDHCGDMDFKVAGTRDGITGFQVDLKLRGLRWDDRGTGL